MRQLLLALLLGVSSICYSQDTLRIPAVELEEFFLALDTLHTQDSIKTILVSDLEAEIILYSKLAQQDSLIIAYKNKEIEVEIVRDNFDFNFVDTNDFIKLYSSAFEGKFGQIYG